MVNLLQYHVKGRSWNFGIHFGIGTTTVPIYHQFDNGQIIKIKARVWFIPFIRLIHWNKKGEFYYED